MSPVVDVPYEVTVVIDSSRAIAGVLNGQYDLGQFEAEAERGAKKKSRSRRAGCVVFVAVYDVTEMILRNLTDWELANEGRD